MTTICVYIATEDELSEVVLRRILRDIPNIEVSLALRRGGFGYLRRNIHTWNQTARGIPFLVLTDLDQSPCASALIANWLGQHTRHPNLLLRVAVREVEAWLLADLDRLAKFLQVKDAQILENPDDLDDPKATLVQLARRSRLSTIREDIVPIRGGTSKQGPNYNGTLCRFVEDFWNPADARRNSPSMDRAIRAIEALRLRQLSYD